MEIALPRVAFSLKTNAAIYRLLTYHQPRLFLHRCKQFHVMLPNKFWIFWLIHTFKNAQQEKFIIRQPTHQPSPNYVGANNDSFEVKFRDVADGTFSAISCLPTSLSSRLPDGDSYSRIFKNDTEPDDDRKFASISLDSGFMSDSKDNEDLGLDWHT